MCIRDRVYAVSNDLLDTPWPKVERTKAAFRRWCESDRSGQIDRSDDAASLLALLHDTELARDDELPSTGVTLERERMLSAPFIVGTDYGTRCSTVLTIAGDRSAHWVERSFDSAGKAIGDVEHRFAIAR